MRGLRGEAFLKVFLLFLVFILYFVPSVFPQGTLTITTYYPTPDAAFRRIRLVPKGGGGSCSNANEGEIYYRSSDRSVYVCKGSGGGGWTQTQEGGGVPARGVAFFNMASCPVGWSPLDGSAGNDDTRGFYIVGRPSGGTLGGTRGTALSNQENRNTGSHRHSISDTTNNASHTHNLRATYNLFDCGTPPQDYTAIYPPFGADTSRSEGPSHSHAVSINSRGTWRSDTNAPYIQYLACIKN